jgi:hypothetical protein
MLVSGIEQRLSCISPQHVSMAAAMKRREMATQSRRESSSEVHAH